MDILQGIEIRGLALYIKKYGALVVSDLQIGYEGNLVSKGIFLPKFQFKDIIEQFEALLDRKYSKIIINGDFKHELGRVSEQEWRESLRLIDYLKKNCDELIIIRGNHDSFLEPILKKRDMVLVNNYLLGDIFFVHGDKLVDIPKKTKAIIIGHEHPALSLKKDGRVEKYKCFLKGKYKGKEIIVLPSFNKLTTGSDVLSEKIMSPFIDEKLKGFEAFVVEDEIYHFGKVEDI